MRTTIIWPLNTPPITTRTLEVLLPTGMPAALVVENSRRGWAAEVSPTGPIFSPDRQQQHGTFQSLTTGTHNASGLGNFSNSTLYFMSRAASALNAAGTLDEVRLSTTERTANWVTTEYNNQNSPGTFITMGSESCR